MSAKKQPTAEKTQATVEKTQTTAKKTQGNLMYLGPTITGVVRNSTVFKDGVLPQKVKECIEQYPAMEKLFVSTKNIPAAVKELNKKQSAMSTIYSQVAKKFN